MKPKLALLSIMAATLSLGGLPRRRDDDEPEPEAKRLLIKRPDGTPNYPASLDALEERMDRADRSVAFAMTSTDYAWPHSRTVRDLDGERYGTPPPDDAARLAAIRRQAKAASRRKR
jgi:hypothetical protein